MSFPTRTAYLRSRQKNQEVKECIERAKKKLQGKKVQPSTQASRDVNPNQQKEKSWNEDASNSRSQEQPKKIPPTKRKKSASQGPRQWGDNWNNPIKNGRKGGRVKGRGGRITIKKKKNAT